MEIAIFSSSLGLVIWPICKVIRNLESVNFLFVKSVILCPVIRRPISANKGLNFNPSFFNFLLFKNIFSDNFLTSFRVYNHQLQSLISRNPESKTVLGRMLLTK